MQEKIKKLIKGALKDLKITDVEFIVEHPEDLKNGDYSTNVAMAGAKKIKTNPKELAEKIVAKLQLAQSAISEIKEITVAGAGFINFHLSRKFFAHSIEGIVNTGENIGQNGTLKDQKIMIEFTDPNPFKPFHIGHLMTNAIGESIARILEHSGAEVTRANYQGDVGLHVAKAIYMLLENPKEYLVRNESTSRQAIFIGKAYAAGSEAYENDPGAKAKIDEINKKIYSKSDEQINETYDWGFKVTMDAFQDLYEMLGTEFDFYFLESQMALVGKDIVLANVGKAAGPDGKGTIFEESDGAIVFKAEKHDPKLHTRVFITSQGLPTYETKELGLTEQKFEKAPDLDLSIIVTANEQMDYMRVVTKAVSLISPEHASKMKHISHGMMRFTAGKMSSRKGNVITGESLLNDVRDSILEKMTDREFSIVDQEKIAADVAVSAIKYSILKQSTGGDIIYDFESSISSEGDSGPYLQYSHARAKSILEKAAKENILPDPHAFPEEIFEVEKLLYKFPEIVLRSAKEYEPHYIANYLIEIARAFNSFYGNNLIVDKKDESSGYKIALTYAFSFVMKTGLHLLGIKAPDKM